MPAGATQKREREYRNLASKFKKSDRYKDREEEVASRIVNKQRARFDETKKAKQTRATGQTPDRNLPIRNYQQMTIPQINSKLDRLSRSDLKKLVAYERSHKNRKTLLNQLSHRM